VLPPDDPRSYRPGRHASQFSFWLRHAPLAGPTIKPRATALSSLLTSRSFSLFSSHPVPCVLPRERLSSPRAAATTKPPAAAKRRRLTPLPPAGHPLPSSSPHGVLLPSASDSRRLYYKGSTSSCYMRRPASLQGAAGLATNVWRSCYHGVVAVYERRPAVEMLLAAFFIAPCNLLCRSVRRPALLQRADDLATYVGRLCYKARATLLHAAVGLATMTRRRC
jgi:hypothetical protein